MKISPYGFYANKPKLVEIIPLRLTGDAPLFESAAMASFADAYVHNLASINWMSQY